MLNILAVIPARAGSKGIPNKNIRLMNGKPLICYAIENAKQSKYITKTVVTTDSQFIEIIAHKQNVSLRKRPEQLCSDNVTLDSVVFDAVQSLEEKFDYIVTMQPTSPTLNWKTLDKAIQYAVENDFDTVISVANRPHLSWKDDNGKIVPNYKERLNRQYLPPNYVETGAFVVSKSNVVNANSRFGKKVGVFVLNENEAIDIDNFGDWIVASNYLSNQKVAIFVNGNNQRGLGHIYRALELADEFFVKPDIVYDKNETDRKVFGTTTHNLLPVNGINDLLNLCKEKQYSLFINDILSTTKEYINDLRTAMPKAKIVNFEDDGGGQQSADLVFNALLNHSDLPNVYTGEKYYISSKLFDYYEPIKISKSVKSVFISFGGADPQNYSDRLLKIITKSQYLGYEFVVVLGKAKKNVEQLLKYNNHKNIKVLFDVNNMPELMSSCDIAITSRGRTSYELAYLGIPTFAMAQNAREEKHVFVSDENGFKYLGLNPSDEKIEKTLQEYLALSKSERERLQAKLLSHDLKNGRKRVMALIKSL